MNNGWHIDNNVYAGMLTQLRVAIPLASSQARNRERLFYTARSRSFTLRYFITPFNSDLAILQEFWEIFILMN